jgi:uncharacterized protein GlcG (DUF336 family)
MRWRVSFETCGASYSPGSGCASLAQPRRSPHCDLGEGGVPRTVETLTLEDAKQMIAAGEAKAASLGIAYNIALVDAGTHLLAFVRQDGALIGSIDLAIDKAATARIFDTTTAELAAWPGPASHCSASTGAMPARG